MITSLWQHFCLSIIDFVMYAAILFAFLECHSICRKKIYLIWLNTLLVVILLCAFSFSLRSLRQCCIMGCVWCSCRLSFGSSTTFLVLILHHYMVQLSRGIFHRLHLTAPLYILLGDIFTPYLACVLISTAFICAYKLELA